VNRQQLWVDGRELFILSQLKARLDEASTDVDLGFGRTDFRVDETVKRFFFFILKYSNRKSSLEM
jgi:hypothetical protein